MSYVKMILQNNMSHLEREIEMNEKRIIGLKRELSETETELIGLKESLKEVKRALEK